MLVPPARIRMSRSVDAIAHAEATLAEPQLASLRKFIWPSDLTEGDTQRWHDQGFVFGDYASTRFGLLQKSGEFPCLKRCMI